MNIFESLENLNISEECFNDIMSIIKEILGEGYDKPLNYWSHIERVHGEPKRKKGTNEPLNKSAELIDKNAEKRSAEIDDAVKREGKDFEEVLNKRTTNKRDAGDATTSLNQILKKWQK